MELKDKLRQLRLAANLSITQAAERIGVHQSTFSDWEAGRTTPRLVQYTKIASGFGVSVSKLLPEEILLAVNQELILKNDRTEQEVSEPKHLEEVLAALKDALRAKDELIVHLQKRVTYLENGESKSMHKEAL